MPSFAICPIAKNIRDPPDPDFFWVLEPLVQLECTQCVGQDILDHHYMALITVRTPEVPVLGGAGDTEVQRMQSWESG